MQVLTRVVVELVECDDGVPEPGGGEVGAEEDGAEGDRQDAVQQEVNRVPARCNHNEVLSNLVKITTGGGGYGSAPGVVRAVKAEETDGGVKQAVAVVEHQLEDDEAAQQLHQHPVQARRGAQRGFHVDILKFQIRGHLVLLLFILVCYCLFGYRAHPQVMQYFADVGA